MLKTVTLRCAAAVPTTFFVGIANPSGSGCFLLELMPAGSAKVVELWLALPAGETIHASCSPASNTCRVALYGAELEGVAD